jgi:hypothetical protein
MTTKSQTTAPAKKRGANTKQEREETIDEKMNYAKRVLSPTVRGAVTTQAFSRTFGDTDLLSLIDELGNQVGKIESNDLSRSEDLLITQAHTLDAIFNELARRAALNMGEHIKATDTYLRLALKAQSQCRATLETLSTIKNPPMIFAKQANISNGPQQVNNGTLPSVAREEKTIEQNELIEAQHGQRLDTGTTGATICADKELETVGAVDRAND